MMKGAKGVVKTELLSYGKQDRTFEDLRQEIPLDERIYDGLRRKKFLLPTHLQRAVIPIILGGSDCIIQSPTGTGKTLAFGIPLLSQLCSWHQWSAQPLHSWRANIQAIILSPSKELAVQLSDVLSSIAFTCTDEIRPWCLVDVPQKVSLLAPPAGAKILIGHPGSVYKLCQLLLPTLKKHETIMFPSAKMLIMDEADLILSVFGYQEESNELFQPTPAKWGHRGITIIPFGAATSLRAQIILASATLNDETLCLSKFALYRPTIIAVTSEGEELALSDSVCIGARKIFQVIIPEIADLSRAQVREFHIPVDRDMQDDYLILLGIIQYKWCLSKIIIFSEDVNRAYRVFLFLKAFGYKICIVSPSQSIEMRLQRIQAFNQGLYSILVGCDPPFKDINVETVDHKNVPTVKDLQSASRKKRKMANLDKTSVVSRGLDFQGVCTVFNFDLPNAHDVYTHRIGRAARDFKAAGIIGLAISFVDKKNFEKIKFLQDHKIEHPEGLDDKTFLALRYRTTDALKSLTPKAIKNYQIGEMSEELLRSSALTDADKAALNALKQATSEDLKHSRMPNFLNNPLYLNALVPKRAL